MKIIKTVVLVFFFVFSMSLFAGVISNERGVSYYYSNNNDKQCAVCKGTGQAKVTTFTQEKDGTLKPIKTKMEKCPTCKGTTKEKRLIEFKKLILKNKKSYTICSITKFNFPYIKVKHTKGTANIHVKLLPFFVLKSIIKRIQMDKENNYYLLHNAQMKGSEHYLHGVLYVNHFLIANLRGYTRVKFIKDENGNYYFIQKHCRENWGNKHVKNKYLLIKTYLPQLSEYKKHLKKNDFIYLRIVKKIKTISREEFKQLKWIQTNNGRIASKKIEVEAEILLKPDKKTVYKILKGEIKIQPKFPKITKK